LITVNLDADEDEVVEQLTKYGSGRCRLSTIRIA